nr:MAG TPA: hypothetical protein [Bacteriophage sp.]
MLRDVAVMEWCNISLTSLKRRVKRSVDGWSGVRRLTGIK